MPESVHLCDFPTANAAARDAALERSMALVQTVVRLGRQLRTENDLKVRQPLSVLHVVSSKALSLAQSIAKQTYIFLEPYVIAAIMYFIIVFPLSKIIAAVERRMSKSVTR